MIRNIAPHQKYSTSNPPINGPIAAPTADTADQIPTARIRSARSGNATRNSDTVAGRIIAAPTAITERARISINGVAAKAAGIETSPKITRPVISRRLRPNRSEAAPAISINEAMISG